MGGSRPFLRTETMRKPLLAQTICSIFCCHFSNWLQPHFLTPGISTTQMCFV
jgi:hypothetical protein